MKEFKPTKAQLIQAQEDVEDGKSISADMRAALNRFSVERTLADATAKEHHAQATARSTQTSGNSLMDWLDAYLSGELDELPATKPPTMSGS